MGRVQSRTKRTPLEEITDRLLLLYLLDSADKCGSIDGDTKFQKLVFLSEREMVLSGVKGFNFYFYKFIHGPYSAQLQEDLGALEDWGAYLPDEFLLTTTGQIVVKTMLDVWSRNSRVVSEIREVSKTWADRTLRSILTYVYSLNHPFYKRPRKIGELKNFTPILFKMQEDKADFVFTLTGADIETLDILLDQENYSHLISPEEEDKPSIAYHGV